jgi:hypothetical protein
VSHAILIADVTAALDAIERHTFGASEDEATERDAHLFHVLEDVRNIRQLIGRVEAEPSEIAGMASALASKSKGVST